MKTKAVVFPDVDKFEVRELTLDEMGPDDIVVRTLVSAISPGTERWHLRGKHLGVKFPLSPGYHRIGIIEKAGKNVKQLKEGDVVYGSATRWKEDVNCQSGAHVERSVGPWGAYSFVSEKIPSLFELEALAFTILIGVANRGIRFADPKPGQKMLTIGAGIIGLCAAQLANLRSASGAVLDNNPERIEFARKLGLKAFLSDDNLEENIRGFAPAGLDILHDTVGHASTTDRLVQMARKHGTLLLQAQYFDKEKCAVDLDQIKIKELTVKSTCGVDNEDRLQTMENIRTRQLQVAPFITHRFSSDENDLLKAYEILHTGKPFNMGIVFNWDK